MDTVIIDRPYTIMDSLSDDIWHMIYAYFYDDEIVCITSVCSKLRNSLFGYSGLELSYLIYYDNRHIISPRNITIACDDFEDYITDIMGYINNTKYPLHILCYVNSEKACEQLYLIRNIDRRHFVEVKSDNVSKLRTTYDQYDNYQCGDHIIKLLYESQDMNDDEQKMIDRIDVMHFHHVNSYQIAAIRKHALCNIKDSIGFLADDILSHVIIDMRHNTAYFGSSVSISGNIAKGIKYNIRVNSNYHIYTAASVNENYELSINNRDIATIVRDTLAICNSITIMSILNIRVSPEDIFDLNIFPNLQMMFIENSINFCTVILNEKLRVLHNMNDSIIHKYPNQIHIVRAIGGNSCGPLLECIDNKITLTISDHRNINTVEYNNISGITVGISIVNEHDLKFIEKCLGCEKDLFQSIEFKISSNQSLKEILLRILFDYDSSEYPSLLKRLYNCNTSLCDGYIKTFETFAAYVI